MTRTLLGRRGLMTAAVLLTTLAAQAQSSGWTIDDQVEGYQASRIRALPDGTLVTAGHPLVRWRHLDGTWETIAQIPTDANVGSYLALAVDLNGTVYVGGEYFTSVPTGRGNRTTLVVNEVFRKGWEDGTGWHWKEAYFDPNARGTRSVEVDAAGIVYALVHESDGRTVVERSVSGGDSDDWVVISDDYDFNQGPDSDSLFPQYDVGDNLRSMAVDGAGNVYVGESTGEVVDVIQGKKHGKNSGLTLVTDDWVVIRRFDAVTGQWRTIQKTPALDEDRASVRPSRLFITSDGIVLYSAEYSGATDTSSSGTSVYLTWAGTYGQDWNWHVLNVPSGTGGTRGTAEGPDGTVYFARTGTDEAGNAVNYVLSSLDLVNWTEDDVPSFIGLSDIAIQSGSVFVSGLGLDSSNADVLRKDLP